MNSLPNKLKKYLQMVIPHIEGKWFLSNGGLLGIKRQGDLLQFDKDLDLYIFPDTIVHYDKIDLKLQKDYMCNKLYNETDISSAIKGPTDWRRFVSFKTSSPELQGFNRADILAIASYDYRDEIIPDINSSCWIDIFMLENDPANERWVVPWYFGGRLFYYTYDELKLVKDSTLGFDIWIPDTAELVLDREYGKDWLIENRNWRW